MKKIITLLLLLFVLVIPYTTEVSEGHEKAGSAMLGDFLKLNWDPASYAMADAYSGFSDNFGGSIFINPAGIARLKNSQLSLNTLYIPLAGIQSFFAGVEQNFGIEASMAIGGAYVDWGEEDETDSTGYVVDTFKNKNTMAFISFGSALGSGLYLGFTAKFIDQTLFNDYQKTFLADVGIQFIPEVFNKIGIGASVTNIGIANAMAYNEASLKAPTTFHLGWVVKLIDTMGSGLSLSFDNTMPVDGTYKLSLGGELNLGNTIILRSGWKALGWDIPEFTFGFGLVFSDAVKLDVAYSDKGNLGKYQLASITMIFGKKTKSKDWSDDMESIHERIDTNVSAIDINSEYIDTNTVMMTETEEDIEALKKELKDLKDILATSSASLKKALDQQKDDLEKQKAEAEAKLKLTQEELARKEAQAEAEKEALRQRMAQEQKIAVEEAARKAADEAAERMRKEYEARMNKVKEEISQDKHIELVEDKRGIVLNLQGINFASGKASIPPYAFATLDRVGRVLGQYPDASIRVEGHTDSLGSPTYNQKLSESRARSVMMYLVDKQAISPRKVEAVGYGESTPIADNSTPEGRSRNRRVEIIIMGTEKKEPVKKVAPASTDPTSSLTKGTATVYVGSYDVDSDAVSEVKKLQEHGYSPSYVKVKIKKGDAESIIYRVKMGSYSEASANKLVEDLKQKGFDAWIKK